MGGIPMPDLVARRPLFEPPWQELNRRNAIVYMHPVAAPVLQRSQIRRGRRAVPANGLYAESAVDQLPGLKLPRAFEQMMLRGNAERLLPRFKLTLGVRVTKSQ